MSSTRRAASWLAGSGSGAFVSFSSGMVRPQRRILVGLALSLPLFALFLLRNSPLLRAFGHAPTFLNLVLHLTGVERYTRKPKQQSATDRNLPNWMIASRIAESLTAPAMAASPVNASISFWAARCSF